MPIIRETERGVRTIRVVNPVNVLRGRINPAPERVLPGAPLEGFKVVRERRRVSLVADNEIILTTKRTMDVKKVKDDGSYMDSRVKVTSRERLVGDEINKPSLELVRNRGIKVTTYSFEKPKRGEESPEDLILFPIGHDTTV